MSTASMPPKATISSICSASGTRSTSATRLDLSEPTRALLDGYAAGLNLYAAQHKARCCPGRTGQGPGHRRSLHAAAAVLLWPGRAIAWALAGGEVEIPPRKTAAARALAIAIAPSRSADGATRLLLNPQGPFAGPLSWYEARVDFGRRAGTSRADLIPGSPLFLAGAGPDIGWGFSANHPDLLDVYTLEGNPNDRFFYRFDGDWRRLIVREVPITIRLWGPLRVTLRREVLTSLQGPVIRNARGLFAIRYAGQDDLKGVEAFYRLNKARTYESLHRGARDGFDPEPRFRLCRQDRAASPTSTTARFRNATPRTIGPRRSPATSPPHCGETYFPFSDVPKVVAPGSGFVISANAIAVSIDFGSVQSEAKTRFSPTMGIETGLSNRARRALSLIEADRSITDDDFKSYKFDVCYAPNSDLAVLVKDLAERNYAGDPLLEEAGQILRRYDLCTDKGNRRAAFALLTAVDGSASRRAGPPPPRPRRRAPRLRDAHAGIFRSARPDLGRGRPPAARGGRSAVQRRTGRAARHRVRSPVSTTTAPRTPSAATR